VPEMATPYESTWMSGSDALEFLLPVESVTMAVAVKDRSGWLEFFR
jgi:hypothetical protein